MDSKYNGQAGQDKFVVKILKEKKDGYFLEIGSNEPVYINNTYLLEKEYNWKGIMIEYQSKYLSSYKTQRENSIHIINDARKVDYKNLLETNNFPLEIDYLQIDLEVNNGSTLYTLQKLDNEIFDKYKFATITFEHDIYSDIRINNTYNTRKISREIFRKRGYVCVFEDVDNQGINPFEDWYVHPDLVDMDYIKYLQLKNNKHYKYTNVPNILSINWEDIEYE